MGGVARDGVPLKSLEWMSEEIEMAAMDVPEFLDKSDQC